MPKEIIYVRFNFAWRTSTDSADLNSSGKAFHSFDLSGAQVKDLSKRAGFDLKLR